MALHGFRVQVQAAGTGGWYHYEAIYKKVAEYTTTLTYDQSNQQQGQDAARSHLAGSIPLADWSTNVPSTAEARLAAWNLAGMGGATLVAGSTRETIGDIDPDQWESPMPETVILDAASSNTTATYVIYSHWNGDSNNPGTCTARLTIYRKLKWGRHTPKKHSGFKVPDNQADPQPPNPLPS